MYLLLGIIILLNIITFITMYVDKQRSKRGEWRIPEKRLFALSLVGGAIGTFYGMKMFRHKTQHNSFKYGIPVMIIINLGSWFSIYQYLL
ncbi:DUF1294 domain-containing protein [Bacillus sp. Marseille-P3661]|uniref:DUF1294 domain-containing protein n=1 Tax=Bacillus sp. Marseille-P3661 TaxID=1936234 RepID=UPI000C865036|nr:DUF1294 domain-containing protein [Bacillus sp. Marseille-P3661]